MDASCSSVSRPFKEFVEDAASLTRVRNRFAKSTDQQLPKIMLALFPKLLRRLEQYSEKLEDIENSIKNGDSMDASAICYLQKVQQDIYGIFSTALERIRGNSSMPVARLITALLPFVGSKNTVVDTWSCAFLQIAVPRVQAEDLDPKLISVLIDALGKLHASLSSYQIQDTELSAITVEVVESRWIRVSWIILDCVMIFSGQRPLVDWDAEHFEPNKLLPDLSDNKFYRRAREEASKGLTRSSKTAMISLFLDLLLFSPDQPSNILPSLSPLASKRMNHRSQTVAVPIEVVGEDRRLRQPRLREDALRMQFGRQARQRIPRTSWSDMTKVYLRYVKLACINFAIWPPGQGMFGEVVDVAALLLSICTGNHDSMHGRVAIEFLNRRLTKKQPVPMPVVTSVLIQILGEEASEDVHKKLSCSKIASCCEPVLGPPSVCALLKRLPLPTHVATQAVQYLIENKVEWSKDVGANGNQAQLIAGSCLVLCRQEDNDHKFLGMRLMGSVYESMSAQPEILSYVKGAVTQILQTVVDLGLSNLNEMRGASVREGQLPLGVPAPFNHRTDLNRLLVSHRQSLKRKNMKRDDAVDARREAYRLVALLPSSAFDQPGDISFEVPNLLLQCAVYEDRYLEHFVIKALDSVLCIYVEKTKKRVEGSVADGNSSLQQEATLLLPSLLEAVCSDVVRARSIGMQWIAKVLVNMDREAAVYLVSCLSRDDDYQVASEAQRLLAQNPISVDMEDPNTTSTYEFQDLGDPDSKNVLRDKLKERVMQLSTSIGITIEKCQKLLLHNGFSVSQSVSAYQEDQEKALNVCGLRFDRYMSDVGEAECGICLDDLQSLESYSMECGHCFCRACWSSYINESADSKFSFLDLRCPQHKCQASLLRSDIESISPSAVAKWDEYMIQTLIEQNENYRCCPGVGCSCIAVKDASSSVSPATVTCDKCKTSYCFRCGEVPHEPATCDDYAGWNRLNSSSRFWLKQHSKPCPGCGAPIEKNGGCNHVQCTSCHTDFCWLCIALLSRHMEAHNCNRYDPVESGEDDFERRALFTANRYEAHDQAEEFASQQLTGFLPDKLLEAFWFLDDGYTDIFKAGLETLVAARRFLKNSYIASLGLRNDAQALQNHEAHHSCLEMFTERLSQLSETNLHRYYLEHGEKALKGHFARISFYTASLQKYQQRILSLRRDR